MARSFTRFFSVLAALCLLTAGVAYGQVSTAGTLVGLVTDPTGAVVAGADVKVRDNLTGALIETKSNAEGKFVVGNLQPGLYTVTVAMAGFQTAEYRQVKISTGMIYDLRATLEVGAIESTVVVEAGAEVLQTTSTVIGTTIAGRYITQLPFTSRDALDLAIMMPGAQTTGRPRATSFLGLPKGAINITIDGINAQDNVLKSSDGFFTIIRPRIDSIEEFSISSAAQTSEQASEGAVQIRMETKRGGNDYKGGVWWYHRNDFLNANYWFSNQAGQPRQRFRLNQFGYKLGGPIIKEKLFFFHAFDFYRNPSSLFRTRTLLTEAASQGLFTYAVSAAPTIPAGNTWTTCTASSCTVNLLAMAAANGHNSTIDSVTGALLTAMNAAVTAPGVGPVPALNLFTRRIGFNNSGVSDRNFPDFRFDWNITKNHQWTGIYHYNFFNSKPDFLNGLDQTFPVAPFNTNQGSQISNRNQITTAWRWNLSTNMSNELRFGIQTAPVSFFPDLNLSLYPEIATNLGTVRARPILASGLITQPLHAFSTQGRNTALGQLIETFSWTRGRHNMTFGANFTRIRGLFGNNSLVHTVNLALLTTDPANPMFSATNLPGSATGDRTNAGTLYATLTGRISSTSGTAFVNPKSRAFEAGHFLVRQVNQWEYGFFGTDSWRVRPTLTLNYGLRWEYQGAPWDPLNISFRTSNGFNDVFGISGPGNLFQPGASAGSVPQFVLNGDTPWYDRDLNNFVPSIGLAWQPAFDHPWWNAIFGGSGKTVFRGGYSITMTREGINNFLSIAFANPGWNGSIFTNGVATPTTAGQFASGSLRLQNLSVQTLTTSPAAFVNSFPIDPSAGHSVNAFVPNLGIPKVQSWSFGIQRELSPSTALEIRYVGNHGTGLWRQYDLNEINIFENGFLSEFLIAKNNLAICQANQVACRTAAGSTSATFASFANLLPALGTLPVPIYTAAFTGSRTGSQTNANFASGTFLTHLANNTAGTAANTLATSLTFWPNMNAAGFPANFFRVNPHARGGAFPFVNDTHTTYNSLQIEMRRRPSKGLTFNGNYTFSKSLTNNFADSSVNFAAIDTFRNPRRQKGPSPWDLRHQFKLQGIWDLPFGPGRRWSSSHAWVNKIIEGWEFNSITRWQSGRVFAVTSGLGGTFNQNDPGVNMIGITTQQLQGMLSVRKLPNGQVFWFPDSTMDSARQRSNPAVLQSCQTAGAFCQRLFLYGPSFFRADWSIVKRTRVTERINIEYRAEFLNAFNHVNFLFGGTAAATVPSTSLQSTNFGRITDAYQDISTTDDPGGRIIQMVLRVNF
jgi:hypothetical protein